MTAARPTAGAWALTETLAGLALPVRVFSTMRKESTPVVGASPVALDPGADREEARRALLAVRGIGPWTAALVALRGLADPDVWLPGDLALRRSLTALGSTDAEAATRWRPWRSYAVMHLWALAAPAFFRSATPAPPTGRSTP